MGVFSNRLYGDDTRVAFQSEVLTSKLAGAMDNKLLESVVDKMAARIADDMYDVFVKEIDKDLIIKETGLKVSEHILDKMFGGTK